MLRSAVRLDAIAFAGQPALTSSGFPPSAPAPEQFLRERPFVSFVVRYVVLEWRMLFVRHCGSLWQQQHFCSCAPVRRCCRPVLSARNDAGPIGRPVSVRSFQSRTGGCRRDGSEPPARIAVPQHDGTRSRRSQRHLDRNIKSKASFFFFLFVVVCPRECACVSSGFRCLATAQILPDDLLLLLLLLLFCI